MRKTKSTYLKIKLLKLATIRPKIGLKKQYHKAKSIRILDKVGYLFTTFQKLTLPNTPPKPFLKRAPSR